jgi:hypothetical protein
VDSAESMKKEHVAAHPAARHQQPLVIRRPVEILHLARLPDSYDLGALRFEFPTSFSRQRSHSKRVKDSVPVFSCSYCPEFGPNTFSHGVNERANSTSIPITSQSRKEILSASTAVDTAHPRGKQIGPPKRDVDTVGIAELRAEGLPRATTISDAESGTLPRATLFRGAKALKAPALVSPV